MARFKVGDIAIFDENCLLNLKEYQPVKVRLIKRIKFNKWLCTPVEPVVVPCLADGYAIKEFIIPTKFLTKSTISEKVVIRCPANMPAITEKDVDCLEILCKSLIGGRPIDSEEYKRVEGLIFKLKYILSFNEVSI